MKFVLKFLIFCTMFFIGSRIPFVTTFSEAASLLVLLVLTTFVIWRLDFK